MPVVSPPTIAALPTPPSTASPANFDTRADAFLGALPAFQAESNAVATNVFANATDAATSASTATTQAATATTQAGIATTQAGIATTQAGIATTQAGIATTQASNASASAAAAAVSAGSVASYPTQTGNAGKFLQTNGTTPSWVSASAGNHEVVVHTGNGVGSTNFHVRRFTTTQTSAGTAITYADSATAGASFTINEDGLYAIYYADGNLGNASVYIGASINYTAVTSLPNIPAANRLIIGASAGRVDCVGSVSRVVRLAAGDVVRPSSEIVSNVITANTLIAFAIRKVGV